MTHPFEAQRLAQAKMLASLPEEARRQMELMFSVGNASFRYHQSAADMSPTEAHYKDWLEGLPAPLRAEMASLGFEACKSVLSFTRFVMELADVGMDEWMRERLTAEEYEYWKGNVQNPA